ncbi:Protein trichome birefringence-like 25 [Dichanthelium oligosanthes]|uniref:Protein trichome birefringence-like 25 n=1 Tax=Dichanthelium oligosanthes TaxID=888268 RepID=A0A1E5V8S9_9POAL|nr:Protein trichome birefringence-like 25 [Dichanthelium oligosanthes]
MGSSPMWWSASAPSPWGRGAGKWWALGGPLAVKAVGFLLLAGLLFRVLCSFPSSPAPALQIAQGKCNLFNGEWIPNPSGPAYTNSSCRFIDGHQNCMMNGRPDKGYLRWKWKPYGCDLPPFDAVSFLDSMRNKAWGLIGDSILRNQVQSLLCLLSQAEEPVEVYHDKEYKNRRWHFQSYNFTVSLVWAPFLIKSDVFENDNGVSTSEIQLHLDILDASWTSQYESFDYVIISGGQWFLKTAVYWENGAVVGCHYCRNKNLVELGYEHLYRKTLQKVFSFIISAEHKPVIFFRTWSPDHFENGEWFNGGSCKRVMPYKKGEYREGYNERVMRGIELKEFNKAAAALRGSVDVERLKLMDTYILAFLRPDGHVGPYRTPYPFVKDSAASVQNDCLHWCVPGPIDAWNDLVMKMAMDQ